MRRFVLPAATAALVGALLVASAAAQDAEGEKPPEPRSWVVGYFVTALGAALGLMAVCRPGRRFPDIKLELPD